MRNILPFGKPIEAYNPEDAIIISILVGDNDSEELINCLWQTFSFSVVDNSKKYLDVHIWHQSAKISRKFIPQIFLPKDTSIICDFLVGAIHNNYYIFLVVARSKIKNFINDTFFHTW